MLVILLALFDELADQFLAERLEAGDEIAARFVTVVSSDIQLFVLTLAVLVAEYQDPFTVNFHFTTFITFDAVNPLSHDIDISICLPFKLFHSAFNTKLDSLKFENDMDCFFSDHNERYHVDTDATNLLVNNCHTLFQ
jgi:hypothetical protein